MPCACFVHAGDQSSFPSAPVALDLDKDDNNDYEELNGKTYEDLHAVDKSTFNSFVLHVSVIPQTTELQTGVCHAS